MAEQVKCSNCDGSSKEWDEPCVVCGGGGTVPAAFAVEYELSGLADGDPPYDHSLDGMATWAAETKAMRERHGLPDKREPTGDPPDLLEFAFTHRRESDAE